MRLVSQIFQHQMERHGIAARNEARIVLRHGTALVLSILQHYIFVAVAWIYKGFELLKMVVIDIFFRSMRIITGSFPRYFQPAGYHRPHDIPESHHQQHPAPWHAKDFKRKDFREFHTDLRKNDHLGIVC